MLKGGVSVIKADGKGFDEQKNPSVTRAQALRLAGEKIYILCQHYFEHQIAGNVSSILQE